MAQRPVAGDPPPPLPGRVVGAAYVLALVTLLVPFAVLGAAFAGVVLIRRGRPGAGIGVLVVAAACVAVGFTAVWG